MDFFGLLGKPDIAALKARRSVGRLISALKYEGLRHDAVDALGEVGDERAVRPLLELLRDPDIWIRCAAARALGQLRPPSAVQPLIEMLRDRTFGPPLDTACHQAATEALSAYRDERADDMLIAALGDKDADVWQGAATALGAIGSRRALGPLAATLAEDPSLAKRMTALEATARIDRGSVAPMLVALRDRNKDLRLAAVELLGRLDATAGIDGLASALMDPDAGVREKAVGVVGSLKDERVIDILLKSIGDAAPLVRWAALSAIAARDRARGEHALLAALEDEDEGVRSSAADALERMHMFEDPQDPGRPWRPQDPRQRLLLAMIKERWEELKDCDASSLEPFRRIIEQQPPDIGTVRALTNSAVSWSAGVLLHWLAEWRSDTLRPSWGASLLNDIVKAVECILTERAAAVPDEDLRAARDQTDVGVWFYFDEETPWRRTRETVSTARVRQLADAELRRRRDSVGGSAGGNATPVSVRD